MASFNLSISKVQDYDVVVVGGGFAGVAAAVSSATCGARTLLIECSGELGGDITKGIVPQVLDHKGKGGLIRRLYDVMQSTDKTSARFGARYDGDGKRIPGTIFNLEYVKYYLEKFCIDAGVNYNKFTEWQRKQLWNEKLGRIEEKQSPVMSPVTLTDIPSITSVEPETLQSLPTVVRYVNLQLQDGTSVVVRNITYEKMIQVFQKLIG